MKNVFSSRRDEKTILKYAHIYIDQICVKVFEKTIRRTEIIDHLFERKFYGAWNRLYKNVVRGFCRA